MQIMCAWCQKVGVKRYSLSMGSELKSFCSEKCFAACRRAYFKRNKVTLLSSSSALTRHLLSGPEKKRCWTQVSWRQHVIVRAGPKTETLNRAKILFYEERKKRESTLPESHSHHDASGCLDANINTKLRKTTFTGSYLKACLEIG